MEEKLKYCGTERMSPHDVKKVFFINLVITYWTLNSIYMQFEYQYFNLSNVFVEHVQILRGKLNI